jgi:tetratricopeptide (TPR) repeat protein
LAVPGLSNGMIRHLKLLILVAVAIIVYGNAVRNGFAMDDDLYIFRNAQVTHHSLKELFQPNAYTAVFRPVTFATLAANFELNGQNPWAYHAFNLLLHAGVTVLLFFVLSTILAREPRGDIIAFVAALLFAVHPIHTEAVTSVIGRSELLAAGFVLLAWLFHLHDLPFLAAFSFLIALLSKESAVAFLPLALAGDYASGKLKPMLRYLSLASLTLFFIGVLWKVQGGRFGLAEIPFVDNPLSSLSPGWRILNALRIAWKYVGLQIYPAKLSCDYSFNAIPVYCDLRHTLPALLAALGLLAAWGWAVWKRKPVLIIAGAIYFAGFAVTANILTPTGTIMAERLAYLPSAGLCLVLALILVWLESRHRIVALSVIAILTVALGVRTIVRNRDWKNDLTLNESAARVVPGSAKVHSTLGGIYLLQRRLDLARTELQLSLHIDPNSPDTEESLGLLESWTGNNAEALRLLDHALHFSNRKNINYDFMAVNLAAQLLQMSQLDEAATILDHEVSVAPGYARAWSNRAALNFKRGELQAARSDAESALRLDPNNSQAQNVLDLTSRTNSATQQR